MKTFIENDIPTSYIDADDLKECLDKFFKGELDNIEPYIDRLYMNPIHLHPSNTLFGQLDSNTLLKCLNQLSDKHRAAIEYHYLESDKSKLILQHYYFHKGERYESASYESWLGENLIEALDYLSYEVLIAI